SQIFQLSFSLDMNGLARRVFRVRIKSNSPLRVVHENVLHGGRVRAWIEDACDLVSIPVQDQRDVVSLSRALPPVAVPGTGQGMTLLSGRGRRAQNKTKKKGPPAHEIWRSLAQAGNIGDVDRI